MTPHTEELRIKARVRLLATVRQIDNRDITPEEDRLRDRLTVFAIEKGLAKAERKAAA